MIGKLLDGRYRIVRSLSEGGFGYTYIAQDIRIPGEPTCVVKHLKPTNSDSQYLQIASRLFRSEAETLAKLGNHDRIPRLLAYFAEDGEFYLVEEFIEGTLLSEELTPGKQWGEEGVIQILEDVLGILEFVHANGVIHRDIKPENIIRRKSDGKLVLIDFGTIKLVQTQLVTQQGQIAATVAVGTLGYMPPEQGRGQPRPSSDLYALGAIGIQALTGLRPKQLPDDVRTGELVWQNLVTASPGLVEILTGMTRHACKDRYEIATEVLQHLQHLKDSYLPTQAANIAAAAIPPTQFVNSPSQPATPPTKTSLPTQPMHAPIQVPIQPPIGQHQPNQPSNAATLPTQPMQAGQKTPLSPPAIALPQAASQPQPSNSGRNNKAFLIVALWVVAILAGIGVGTLLANKGKLPIASIPNPSFAPTPSSPSPSIPQTSSPAPTSSTPNPTRSPAYPSLSETEAVDRVKALVAAKSNMFAPPFNRELLSQLTTGDEYEKRKGSIDWLQKNNAYYQYGAFQVNSAGQFSLQGNQATVVVEIAENPTLYVNGQVDQSQSVPSRGKYLCVLRLENGVWKITNLNKND